MALTNDQVRRGKINQQNSVPTVGGGTGGAMLLIILTLILYAIYDSTGIGPFWLSLTFWLKLFTLIGSLFIGGLYFFKSANKRFERIDNEFSEINSKDPAYQKFMKRYWKLVGLTGPNQFRPLDEKDLRRYQSELDSLEWEAPDEYYRARNQSAWKALILGCILALGLISISWVAVDYFFT